jgi:hypothetical protein
MVCSVALIPHDKIVSVDKEVAKKSWLTGLKVRMIGPYLGSRLRSLPLYNTVSLEPSMICILPIMGPI